MTARFSGRYACEETTMATRPLILLIDDDANLMQYYRDALLDQFDVEYASAPADALGFLERRGSEVAGIVLDIMMPHGLEFTEAETDEGLQTGVALYQRLRQRLESTPVVVLTNVAVDSLRRKFPADRFLHIAPKLHHPPTGLAALLDETINKTGRQNPGRTVNEG
jgi:CheY-like chemotaxis protein